MSPFAAVQVVMHRAGAPSSFIGRHEAATGAFAYWTALRLIFFGNVCFPTEGGIRKFSKQWSLDDSERQFGFDNLGIQYCPFVSILGILATYLYDILVY